MAESLPPRIIAEIHFIGRSAGQVKALSGFKKGHHTLPDAANATTNAFLGRLCLAELTAGAERIFQDVRTGLGYKRKDLALSISSPAATLTAKDFVLEMAYALEDAEPSRYAVVSTLRGLRNAEVVRLPEFARVFAGQFSELGFALQKGGRVESVIDAIEALEADSGLTVDYPSDCRACTVRAAGVAAEVRFSGHSLEMIFPRAGAPGELMDAFEELRAAFQISKALAGLVA